jgi:hypothetical protein
MTPIPTLHLRFVERVVPAPEHGEGIGKQVRILQQWWASDPDCYEDWAMQVNGEWRDIPLEVEA